MATTYLNNSSNTVTPGNNGFDPDDQREHQFDGTEDRTYLGDITPDEILTAGGTANLWSGGPFNASAVVIDSGAA